MGDVHLDMDTYLVLYCRAYKSSVALFSDCSLPFTRAWILSYLSASAAVVTQGHPPKPFNPLWCIFDGRVIPSLG